MYKRIIVPVDLKHPEQLEKAMGTAADLSKHYGAKVDLVSVTAAPPGEIAHQPTEFLDKLKTFAAEQGDKYGVTFGADAEVIPDPAVDLDEALREAIHKLGADLVIMASHVPTLWDYLSASNAGHLASHADVSVFVVR